MSDAPPEATPSPIPVGVPHRQENDSAPDDAQEDQPSAEIARPHPKLRFQVEDLVHKGAVRFFQQTVPADILTDAITTVMRELYPRAMPAPPVRSITLILHSFDGVAYTKGMDLDNDHKELHFSLDYIANIDDSTPTRLSDEIHGVIVHEMVHVWQWNGKGTCPGGLIEGIADYVRLRAKLAPPHWTRNKGGEWDAGYDRTGYFLDWLERKYGYGSVVAMNDALRDKRYEEDKFWQTIFARSVKQLWEEYQASFDRAEPNAR
jgi:Peptidase of plants and bacteria